MVKIKGEASDIQEFIFTPDYNKNLIFAQEMKKNDYSQAPKVNICVSHDKNFKYCLVSYTYKKKLVTYANYGVPVMLNRDWVSFRQEFNNVLSFFGNMYEKHVKLYGEK